VVLIVINSKLHALPGLFAGKRKKIGFVTFIILSSVVVYKGVAASVGSLVALVLLMFLNSLVFACFRFYFILFSCFWKILMQIIFYSSVPFGDDRKRKAK
jgi:hypothetical protein